MAIKILIAYGLMYPHGSCIFYDYARVNSTFLGRATHYCESWYLKQNDAKTQISQMCEFLQSYTYILENTNINISLFFH